MDADRKRRLEAAGFKFGTVGELFGLSEAEEQLVEMKVAIAEAIRVLRDVRSLSQAEVARLVGSGQARISKLERSGESTSLDTLVRCMLVLGASRKDLAKTIAKAAVRPKARKAAESGRATPPRRGARSAASHGPAR
jgi:transcriptional regulator with XRE-family HTH domain